MDGSIRKYVVIAAYHDWMTTIPGWSEPQILRYLLESFRTGTDIAPHLGLSHTEHMNDLKLLPTVLIQHSLGDDLLHSRLS